MMPEVSPNVGGQRSFNHVAGSLRQMPALADMLVLWRITYAPPT